MLMFLLILLGSISVSIQGHPLNNVQNATGKGNEKTDDKK
jgi:hypothetical protein